MVDVSGASRRAGQMFGEYLDSNGDGRITSGEQLAPLVEAIRQTPPEQRGELTSLLQGEIDRRFPPDQRNQLAPEMRRNFEAASDFIQSIGDPARLNAFCQDPSRISAANQAINGAINTVSEGTRGLGNFMSQEEIDRFDREIQAQITSNPDLQRLRNGMDPQGQRTMDHVTRNIRLDTIQAVADGFRRGLEDAAPQGIEAIDVGDACHGLGVHPSSGRTGPRR